MLFPFERDIEMRMLLNHFGNVQKNHFGIRNLKQQAYPLLHIWGDKEDKRLKMLHCHLLIMITTKHT